MMGSFLKSMGVALFAAAIAGCGGAGGGAGGGGGSNNEPLEITVPDTIIDYGDRVTVSWTGEDLQYMDTDRQSTNFGITRNQTSGSISDRPATDTTYRIRGVTRSEGYVSATVTVRVRPSKKSFLVVGSKSDPLVLQIVSQLKGITTGSVSLGQKIPSTPIADVFVILDSGTFDTTDEPRVRSLLSQGGRILLLSRSINELAGVTKPEGTDIKNVQSWFGANWVYSHFGGCEVLNTHESVPISLVHVGNDNGSGDPDGTIAVKGLQAGATPLWQDEAKRTAAFVFKPSIGGRLAHMGGLSFGPSHVHEVLRDLFLAECRWLADYE